MNQPRYWYFNSEDRKPQPSNISPAFNGTIFPIGTQCLDTWSKDVHQVWTVYQGSKPLYELIRPHMDDQVFPEVRTHALLLGITIQ